MLDSECVFSCTSVYTDHECIRKQCMSGVDQ